MIHLRIEIFIGRICFPWSIFSIPILYARSEYLEKITHRLTVFNQNPAMIIGFTETGLLKKKQPTHQKRPRRLFCKTCRKLVSDIKYLTSTDGGSPKRIFRNPKGYIYEIITLSSCECIVDASMPFLKHSWFPDYHWIIINCASCQTHLGWRWKHPRRIPNLFYGLICERLEEKEKWKFLKFAR